MTSSLASLPLAQLTVARWLGAGEWRAHPGRVLLSVAAIAVGVALGFAVHLINASALTEFAGAIRSVNGAADLQVRAVRADGFDEHLYGRVALLDGIAAASPVVEAEVAIVGAHDSLRVLGIDALRAAAISPALRLQASADDSGTVAATLFDDNAIWLSGAALRGAGKQVGDGLDVLIGTQVVRLRIAGVLPAAPDDQRLGVMDIAAAQWRLGRLGRLSRIDLKLDAGVDAGAVRTALTALLPADALISSDRDDERRGDGLSRAYRVNLDMLALMALFTGAFLVYSTQSLSVTRRHAQLALLRVIGVTRRALIGQVLGEGLLLGLAGSLLGLLLGVALAAGALALLGGDLGGGYFQGTRPALVFAPGAALLFFVLGLAAALLGSLLPARAAASAQPAVALKSAGDGVDPRHRPRARLALALLVGGGAAAFLPPLAGLPLFGYVAMGLLLFGGIAAMPWLTRVLLAPLARRDARRVPLDLAIKRLWGAPTQAAVALCGIVASASLMVAMAVMIASFRNSVDDWLGQILPADLYARAAGAGTTSGSGFGPGVDSAGFDPATRLRIAALPGVRRADFLKVTPLRLAPDRPPVALIARAMDPASDAALPLLRGTIAAHYPADVVPVWVSEAMVDLYDDQPGRRISLPLGAPGQVFLVAGVWRDYARQHGAIAMRDADYTRLTGDTLRSDVGLTLDADKTPATIARLRDQMRALVAPALAARLEFAEPAEIRKLSLRIFDRSFAVTYLLQAVAIAIGLSGVAATFSAQTLARAREFGMLRHVGVLRAQVVAMLGLEGALLGLVGVLAGVALGLAMSQVLIHVVNPQSFHWTMDTHVPWGLLALVSLALLLAAAGTAMLAGRRALGADALRAVREDW